MTIQQIFSPPNLVAQLEAGPLGSFLSALAAQLQQQRYAKRTIQMYLRAVDTFGAWLQQQAIPISALDEALVTRYVASLARRPIKGAPSGALPHEALGLTHLLRLLRQQQVIAPPHSEPPTTPVAIFLTEYQQYLSQTLGSAPSTQRQHLLFARRFLTFAFPAQVLSWAELSAPQLTQFVTQQAARRHRHGKKGPASSVRVLLRYLTWQGKIRAGLEAAIPTQRTWQHASLPPHLSVHEVAQVLQAVQDGSALGTRDYAILLLLARLGLRAGEVLRLRLDDLDWQAGALLVHASKTQRERNLPLSEEVGTALLAYLRTGRPTPSSHRALFLHHTAPYQPLQDACAVGAIVRRALQRAGIERARGRAHLLRHSVATRMVNHGASFKEVADVLGHQSLQTTAIYAKLNLAALAAVALPWPGGEL